MTAPDSPDADRPEAGVPAAGGVAAEPPSPADHSATTAGDEADTAVSGAATTDAGDASGDASGDGRRADRATGSRRRRVAGRVITGLAALFVLFALVLPNEVDQLTPEAFVRIPVEALVGAALVLALPGRARRVAAAPAGAALGLVAVLKVIDMGYDAVLARPFDPVLDWVSMEAGIDFLTRSMGTSGAVGVVVAVVLLTIGVLVVMTFSVLRLSRLVAGHRTVAARSVLALGAVWTACALLGTELVPGVPVASGSAAGMAYDRALQVRDSLRDQETFAKEAAVDAFRDTPGDRLLTALRGKDVLVAFVESYGRDAVENPKYATQIGAVLQAGNQRLGAAGFGSRSGFLTSSTAGGGSWLAHATLLSGLWINNEQRYRNLVASDRLTLNGAFRRAGWRTVGVMPGITRAWPEGSFFGYDKIYDARNLGYRGPNFSYTTMPDQYTLSAFERLERSRPDHRPVMAEMPLLSSHAPWAVIPRLVGWNQVGDGSVFEGMVPDKDPGWPARDRIPGEYRRSLEYSLNTLISYVETYGDDDLVLVFLGDHQPTPLLTSSDATRDVPITIVARDRRVLDQISGWGWSDGLKPGPDAPVWRMNAFRDRFLSTFGSQPGTPAHAGPRPR